MSMDIVGPIRESFDLIAPQADELVSVFYQTLFENNPQLRAMFPADMTEQKKKLLGAVGLVVKNVDKLDTIEGALEEMGARHNAYGALDAHYPVVRDTMLAAMAQVAGGAWNQTYHDAWEAGLNAVAGIMVRGAHKAKRRAA